MRALALILLLHTPSAFAGPINEPAFDEPVPYCGYWVTVGGKYYCLAF